MLMRFVVFDPKAKILGEEGFGDAVNDMAGRFGLLTQSTGR